MKVTVVGAGNVGSILGYQLAMQNLASEIVFTDLNEKRAKAEALDINHSMAHVNGRCDVKFGNEEDTANSDFVIFTASAPFPPQYNEDGSLIKPDRMQLAKLNISLYNKLIPSIVPQNPNAFYLVVANPNDIIVKLLSEKTDIPNHKIIGTGTAIDTGRILNIFHRKYERQYNFPEINIIGEHGDNQFIPSVYNRDVITNQRIEEMNDVLKQALAEAGQVFIDKEFTTTFAIVATCCNIINAIQRDSNLVLPVSCEFNHYGFSGHLSLPRMINKNGIVNTYYPQLTDSEVLTLKESVDSMDKVVSMCL